jgi:hypothetical protein
LKNEIRGTCISGTARAPFTKAVYWGAEGEFGRKKGKKEQKKKKNKNKKKRGKLL